MIKAVDEGADGVLDGGEIANHVVGVKGFAGEDDVDSARMAMRIAAAAWMFVEKVATFDFKGFTNAILHGDGFWLGSRAGLGVFDEDAGVGRFIIAHFAFVVGADDFAFFYPFWRREGVECEELA